MKAQGVPMTDEILRAVRARDKADADMEAARKTEIWPDMAPAVLTFMSMTTQWRVNFFGQRIGLDYAQVQPCAQMLGVVIDTQAFLDLQTMERAALEELGRRKGG